MSRHFSASPLLAMFSFDIKSNMVSRSPIASMQHQIRLFTESIFIFLFESQADVLLKINCLVVKAFWHKIANTTNFNGAHDADGLRLTLSVDSSAKVSEDSGESRY